MYMYMYVYKYISIANFHLIKNDCLIAMNSYKKDRLNQIKWYNWQMKCSDKKK